MSDIYRKVYVRMWGDAKVRSLTPMMPSGQALWIHALTGEQTTQIPGVFRIGESAWAEQLGWPLKGFREAFAELFREGLVKADWETRLVWVVNGLKWNAPSNGNIVKGWLPEWKMIPECSLKVEIFQHFKQYLEGLPKPFPIPFDELFGKPFREPIANPEAGSRKQQQKQQQEGSGSGERVPLSLTADTPKPKRAQRSETKPDDPRSVAVNRLYCELYTREEGHPPSGMSRASNAKLAAFSKDHGENAFEIVRWFFKSPDRYYRAQGWPIGLMIAQAPKLWRECQDNQKAMSNLAAPIQSRRDAHNASLDIAVEEANAILAERGIR